MLAITRQQLQILADAKDVDKIKELININEIYRLENIKQKDDTLVDVLLTKEEYEEYTHNKTQADYYDRLQSAKKLSLNSL